MRNKLKTFIEYKDGEKIRTALHEIAKEEYAPKYQDRYMGFMNENECEFTINHAQSVNHPYYFTMFTIKSQHVMGDCIEECLDKAMDAMIKGGE